MTWIPENYYPLQNIRKSIAGSWFLVHKIEYHAIPSGAPYEIRLKEVPDDGSLALAPSISGAVVGSFTETTGVPGINQFIVRYSSGEIEFNYQNAGEDLTVYYYAKGSAINANDINYLKSLIDDNYHHINSSNFIFTGTENLAPSATTEIVHSLGTEDFSVQLQYKTAAYSWCWVNARAVLSFEIYDQNTLKITNQCEDIIDAENWRVLITTFRIPVYLGNQNIPIAGHVDYIHSYNTQDLLFQIQSMPTSGDHQDKWIDGSGIMAVSIIDNNTIRMYNNGTGEILTGKYRLFVNLF